MSYEQRQAKCRFLGKGIDGWVDIIAPPGIRHWDLLSKFVDPLGAEFVVALSVWESSPSPETESSLNDVHHEVLAAWRRAAAEFTTEGAS